MPSVVVVMGAGRSGTSMVMHLLHALGMHVSERMVPARYHNPLGPMEDLEIAKVFDQLILPSCAMNRLLPLNKNEENFNKKDFNKGVQQLKSIIKSRVENTPPNKIWGFKDPVVSNFLPYLLPIFNQLAITPKFILCVRNPASVVRSRKVNFSTSENLAELGWLTNTVYSLKNTGCDCYIVHYEDFLNNDTALNTISDIAVNFNLDSNKAFLAKNIITDSLNRSSLNEHKVINNDVNELYSEILNYRGAVLNRNKLLDKVMKCEKSMIGYSGWLESAYGLIKCKRDLVGLRDRLKEYDKLLIKANELESSNNDLKLKISLLSKEIEVIELSLLNSFVY